MKKISGLCESLEVLSSFDCSPGVCMQGLFSKIIAGKIPSFKLFEDEWTYAFLTKDSVQLGHSLIIPKVEVDYFIEVPEPFYSKVFQAARPLARAIHQVTGCRRVGTVIAGFDVPHFHYHLMPLFGVEDLDLTRGRERPASENLKMQAEIVAALSGILEKTQ
jgi:histidine triad (HIT) family protein